MWSFRRLAFTRMRSPALQITGVTVGVVIRDQVATTMMEIQLRNPGAARQEAELLVPVPDGAVVRGFAFQGHGAEPSARLLPRDEGAGDLRSHRRPGPRPGPAGVRRVQPGPIQRLPGRAGGTQAVRLTYEHLLPANGDRVDYVLPRSESVEYTVPWKIAVKITSATPIAAIYSPSHRLRTARPEAERGGRRACRRRRHRARPVPVVVPPRARRRLGLAVRLSRPQDRRGILPAPGRIAAPAAKPDRRASKREVTLVIDRSGSMRGEKLAQVREAALQVLAGLDDGEAFNIILYNEGVEPFAERPVRKSRATIKDATEFLEGMTAQGRDQHPRRPARSSPTAADRRRRCRSSCS